MPYSFIDPVTKSPFSPGVRRVWFAGALLIGSGLALSAVLHFNSAEQKSLVSQEHNAQETLKTQVEQLIQQQSKFESGKSLRQQTYTANQLLTDQLSNLLDLIPEDTTLNRFEMNATMILYEGDCDRFEALRTDLDRALSGQYRLTVATATPAKGKVHFILRFDLNGEAR